MQSVTANFAGQVITIACDKSCVCGPAWRLLGHEGALLLQVPPRWPMGLTQA